MDEQNIDEALASNEKLHQRSMDGIEKLFDTAHASAVFGEAIATENLIVIPAAEVGVGMGLGFGSGYGTETSEKETDKGGGGGGGGGGAAQARPVAAIIVDEYGARVEPVVDVTKLGLAFLTALGSMLIMLARMNKASRQ